MNVVSFVIFMGTSRPCRCEPGKGTRHETGGRPDGRVPRRENEGRPAARRPGKLGKAAYDLGPDSHLVRPTAWQYGFIPSGEWS